MLLTRGATQKQLQKAPLYVLVAPLEQAGLIVHFDHLGGNQAGVDVRFCQVLRSKTAVSLFARQRFGARNRAKKKPGALAGSTLAGLLREGKQGQPVGWRLHRRLRAWGFASPSASTGLAVDQFSKLFALRHQIAAVPKIVVDQVVSQV